jgi:hypothetical protein
MNTNTHCKNDAVLSADNAGSVAYSPIDIKAYIDYARRAMPRYSTRSQYDRAKAEDCLAFLDELDALKNPRISTAQDLERALLSGASCWKQYSYGGCSLVYNCDIAEHYLPPSKRNRVKAEDLLDLQAQALREACQRLKRLFVEWKRSAN